MMEDRRYSACLRICSKTMNVTEITNTLATVPTKAHDKGTPFSSRAAKSRLRQESLWLLESSLDRLEPLDAHLEKLAVFIEEKAAQLKNLISECNIDIFCGVFSESGQGGFVLDSVLLKKISLLPIDIVFDIYVSSSSEEGS